MKGFVEATLLSRGEWATYFTAVEEICMLKTTAAAMNCPNTNAVARTLAKLTDYAKSCVKPAFDYFTEKFKID